MKAPMLQRTQLTLLAEQMVRHPRVLNYATPRDVWAEQAKELCELIGTAAGWVLKVVASIYGSRNWW